MLHYNILKIALEEEAVLLHALQENSAIRKSFTFCCAD